MARSAASASVFGSGSVSLLLLAVAASLLVGATAWKEGRATYYGNEPWGWSIHFGSEFDQELCGLLQWLVNCT